MTWQVWLHNQYLGKVAGTKTQAYKEAERRWGHLLKNLLKAGFKTGFYIDQQGPQDYVSDRNGVLLPS